MKAKSSFVDSPTLFAEQSVRAVQCRRECAVAQRGNVSEKAGTTTHKRVPIALRRRENRHLAGLTHIAQGGHARKARCFREKTAD